MKINLVLIIFLAIGAFPACKQTKSADDAEQLKSVLRAYFDGIKTRDIKKLNEVTTNNFILFEDGKVWTNDSLINSLSSLKSFEGDWKFYNMKVNVDNSSGDITYYDHGDFIVNDTARMSFNWIESATFRKIDGRWKLNFLHSTLKK